MLLSGQVFEKLNVLTRLNLNFIFGSHIATHVSLHKILLSGAKTSLINLMRLFSLLTSIHPSILVSRQLSDKNFNPTILIDFGKGSIQPPSIKKVGVQIIVKAFEERGTQNITMSGANLDYF